jgi:hypothetical protein
VPIREATAAASTVARLTDGIEEECGTDKQMSDMVLKILFCSLPHDQFWVFRFVFTSERLMGILTVKFLVLEMFFVVKKIDWRESNNV